MAAKKMTTGKKLLIGGAVIGGGYLLYSYFLKDLLFKKDTTPGTQPSGDFTPAGTPSIDDTIINAGNLPQNVVQTAKVQPLGTPDKELYYDLILKKGDKGAEVHKLQRITNVIAKNYGTNQIGVDGSWGPQTEEKVTNVYGVNKITLRSALKKMNRVQNWVNAGKKGKESDYPDTAGGTSTSAVISSLTTSWMNPYQKF